MNIKVLIAGAGPTGLMAGCQLRRFGIDCLIIDKKSEPTKESRALAVQARTMELYDQMGVADEAVSDGQIISYINIILKGRIVRKLPIGIIGKGLSPYPYILIYEQNKNEKLLLDYYLKHGGKILWNTELTALAQDEKGIRGKVKKVSGTEEEITAEYAIGADGAKSIARHSAGLELEGGTYGSIFFVADTRVEWDFGYEQLFLSLSGDTFSAMFGMRGEHRFRLIGAVPKGFEDKNEITFEDIREQVEKNWGMKIHFVKTDWFSIYHVHHRVVSAFSKGRVFLCGDAAHIHSPVGGQGMNTGLQDAYNLCWKLAMVIKGTSSKKILESYNEERLPFAKRLVNTTDRVFSFVTSENFIIRFLRLRLIPFFTWLALKFNFSRRLMYMTVSQTGINYRGSSISSGGNDKIKSGDRVPYTEIYDAEQKKMINLYVKLKEPMFHLVLFGNYDEKFIKDFEGIQSGLVKVVKVANTEENKNAYKMFGVKDRAYFIIRPDNYIGYISKIFDVNEIKSYFKNIFAQ